MESVCGGTGWGVQMTIDYNRQFNQFGESKELFVFDLDETCWFRLVKTEDETNDSTRAPFKFERMKDYTPLLARKSAIIGMRDLPHWGRDAIKRLFDNTLEKLFHTKNIVENEYEDYVAKMPHDDPDVLNQSPPPPPKDTPCNPPDLMDENDNPWVWLWGTGWIRRKKIADNKKAEETEDPIEYWSLRIETSEQAVKEASGRPIIRPARRGGPTMFVSDAAIDAWKARRVEGSKRGREDLNIGWSTNAPMRNPVKR